MMADSSLPLKTVENQIPSFSQNQSFKPFEKNTYVDPIRKVPAFNSNGFLATF